MIESIFETPDLFAIVRACCEENDVSISFCEELFVDNEVDDNRVAILKIDSYYNTKNFAKPPPSIDCLIVINESDDKYALYLIELKGIKKAANFDKKNIVTKFKTTIDDFLSKEFSNIFLNDISKQTFNSFYRHRFVQ